MRQTFGGHESGQTSNINGFRVCNLANPRDGLKNPLDGTTTVIGVNPRKNGPPVGRTQRETLPEKGG